MVLTIVTFLMLVMLFAAIGQTGRILGFKNRGGRIVTVIGMTPQNGFYLGVAILALFYGVKMAFGLGSDAQTMQPLSLGIYFVCLAAMTTLGFVGGLDRLKVRENGLSNANLMVTWLEINDFHWNGHSLILDHRNLFFKSWKTRLRLREDQFDVLKPFLAKVQKPQP